MHTPASGARKGRAGARGKAAAAAADGAAAIDEDAQQEVTVTLAQKLPALLTQFQAEPAVVTPLLAIVPHLRLEQWLLSSQTDAYRALLQQVGGCAQRC